MKKYLLEQAQKVKNHVIKDLDSKKKSGQPFSFTMDEWTSIQNRKFFNINLHHLNGFDCLGLGRANGSLPAPRLVELVDEHLKSFDIDMKKDIVCAVTDGASVMGVFGRLIPCLHLKCMCHAVNLSICDVLYPKKATKRKHDVSKFSKQSSSKLTKSQISQRFESSDEEETCEKDEVIHILKSSLLGSVCI